MSALKHASVLHVRICSICRGDLLVLQPLRSPLVHSYPALVDSLSRRCQLKSTGDTIARSCQVCAIITIYL
jgi:hypothetical protein